MLFFFCITGTSVYSVCCNESALHGIGIRMLNSHELMPSNVVVIFTLLAVSFCSWAKFYFQRFGCFLLYYREKENTVVSWWSTSMWASIRSLLLLLIMMQYVTQMTFSV